MLKLYETEKFNLTDQEKSMARAILGHLYYYLDNGFTETQIKNVLEKLLVSMQK